MTGRLPTWDRIAGDRSSGGESRPRRDGRLQLTASRARSFAFMQKPPLQTTLQRILLGCLLGGVIGCPAGALGLLIWAIFRDPFFLVSIGSGFLGLIYTPLIGGVAGVLLGGVIGGVLMALPPRHRAK